MITVRLIEGRRCPLVICDTCGQTISDPGMAAVVYDLKGPEDQAPEFAHKGGCHEALDTRIRDAGGLPGWSELGRWMVDLLHNTGIRGDELGRWAEHAAAFHELGL